MVHAPSGESRGRGDVLAHGPAGGRPVNVGLSAVTRAAGSGPDKVGAGCRREDVRVGCPRCTIVRVGQDLPRAPSASLRDLRPLTVRMWMASLGGLTRPLTDVPAVLVLNRRPSGRCRCARAGRAFVTS